MAQRNAISIFKYNLILVISIQTLFVYRKRIFYSTGALLKRWKKKCSFEVYNTFFAFYFSHEWKTCLLKFDASIVNPFECLEYFQKQKKNVFYVSQAKECKKITFLKANAKTAN